MQTITNEKERKWARASVEAGVTSKLGLDVHAGQITVCRQDGGLVPPRWDAAGKRVKTDGRDARELCDRLDRSERGNPKAFSVVRVPTPEQEQRWASFPQEWPEWRRAQVQTWQTQAVAVDEQVTRWSRQVEGQRALHRTGSE